MYNSRRLYGNPTYRNNIPYGLSSNRPVSFVKYTKETIDGKESLLMHSSNVFIDELRSYQGNCRMFYAEIDFCLNWNIQLPVYITDDEGVTKYRLISKNNGFAITSDQIQPFSGGGYNDVIKMWICYDELFGENHITIANYFPRHTPCHCEDTEDPTSKK